MALLFAAAALALGACGGSDDDSTSNSSPSAARGATGEQSTTSPATGASGATGSKSDRPKRTAKSKQRSDETTGAGEGNSPTAAPAAPTTNKKKKPQPRTLTPEELKQVEPNYQAQARELCKASTLAQLAEFYGIDSGDPQKVAEAFAADYLAGLRDAVTKGCKEGLLESK